ncbi:polynucleotide kinase [Cronobacter phage ESP2949-1]|uniref:Polynucleotide kinase n=1 Tax=Cronobacter phage ESP2949-1 TaxID=2920894 RepID=G1CSS1_9CAUD|nr:polynucleotide kinase [Cronobacter phage ESP2949-1]AEM24796.1 polynucleotide kinase [Cronobacter phage ESP2949-1]
MKNVVIFDLDGTLACGKHRLHLLPTKDLHLTESWTEFNLACADDALIEANAALAEALWYQDYEVIILTGRSDIARDLTVVWLDKHGIYHDRLIMRRHDDNRKDTIIKEEELRRIGLDRILLCVDDRLDVARHLRSLGLTVLVCTEYADTDRVDLGSHGVDK